MIFERVTRQKDACLQEVQQSLEKETARNGHLTKTVEQMQEELKRMQKYIQKLARENHALKKNMNSTLGVVASPYVY